MILPVFDIHVLCCDDVMASRPGGEAIPLPAGGLLLPAGGLLCFARRDIR